MIPTIETNRLRLVAPNKDAFETYKKFYTDGSASKMYGGPIGIEQTWARLKADVGSWYLLGFGVWVIQLKSNDSYVGTCGFWQGKEWPKELTWWVLPEARGQGVATEASLAVLKHAYNVFNWETVETYMNDDNGAARALVEKLGGVKVRRQQFNDGLSRDIYFLPKP
ncbi:GNAT family N-acetyltransferase [Pseudoalteromonas maricaloris]|uniref:GNAT family N-acetyltransferase n=1 Tax=Pseudoalteromonas TaxID=53246 RepID=UPI001EFDE8F1|nr:MULTISPECIES: GNAT family N-acetyltransferase [Pseudoalteromonas]MCG9769722.1 GNAT family N-acetyltransferase [Pseudoalteromonas piscicida]USE68999.1 GNAT family N-acetyltransferase [Pseudoalteromonas flavipulchra]